MPVLEKGRLPGFRIGTVGPLIIAVFDESATAERLAMLDKVQGEFLASAPRMYALNVITGASIKAPAPEVREIAARLQTKYNATTVASATVLTMKGLGAVIARGFLAGLVLVSRGNTPTQVFKTVTEAVEWLQRLPSAPPELSRVSTLAQEVEAFVSA
jgi:hypothetical protein